MPSSKEVCIFLLVFMEAICFPSLTYALENNNDIMDVNVFQGIAESKTGLVGWRLQGECHGKSKKGSYRIIFYSPPRRKDVGGYGIIEAKYNGKENIYSGYEFYPFAGGKDCDFIKSYNDGELLVLDTENWALSKRYVIAIQSGTGDVSAYSYSLKNTEIYKDEISRGAYLVAGFGVCPENKNADWISDIYCTAVDSEDYRKAKTYLEESMGLELSPEIPAIGKGVFKYYLITTENNEYSQKQVDELILNYLRAVAQKVNLLRERGSQQEYYNSLLAIDSVTREFPIAENESISMGLTEQENSVVVKHFQNYWEIIFQ